MAEITLRAVTRTSGSTAAVKDGTVTPGRYALEFEEVPVLVQAFRRMVRSVEFDVTEMAVTTYLCAKAAGKPFTALPLFLVRGFHHGAIVRPAAADTLRPKDLEGATVGVNRGYTVTTGVWARGILRDEYGVNTDRVTWAPTGDEHVTEYRAPPNVLPPSSADLGELVAAGELTAGVGITADGPGLAPLIADPEKAGFAALRDRGLYPINHLAVVKDELLAAHPDLAADVFWAYTEAKRRYIDRLRSGAITNPTPTDLMHKRVMEITGKDPLPYGIGPNRAMLSLLMGHAVSQHILPRPVPLETLFARGTLDLVG
ncbi:MAG: 4,5-dihydroxyphthalate decarboxylase [Actinomycetia bacterium]|jgi:4,5-dihydroxyphthalate decarboxylase|nr:4,5-dihydroxyphthalate decarboxylase [Actinomycetes bacterium]